MLVIVLKAEAKLDRHADRRLAAGHRPARADAELEIGALFAVAKMPAVRLPTVIAAELECDKAVRRVLAPMSNLEADLLTVVNRSFGLV